ncbi:MAG TPA: hypothetical protein VK909_02600 [Anaerolineales bacterium]|nr:hypothetical protein [Anaerolineales bacterium]
MSSQVDDLVQMRDIESLYELMTEDEEWLTQMDAAEGLIKLGDRRGFEYVTSALMSDDEEILEVAQEIVDSPEYARLRSEIDAEQRRKRADSIQSAKKRLQSGGKVFRYKMVYLPVNALMEDDPLSEGFDVPALEEHGLAGWEIINVIPSRGARLVGSMEGIFTGAYFLLKKEVLPGEANDLDQ